MVCMSCLMSYESIYESCVGENIYLILCFSNYCIIAFPTFVFFAFLTSVFTTTSHLHAQQSSATTWSAAYLSDNLLQGLLSRGTPPGLGPWADLGEPAVWPTF